MAGRPRKPAAIKKRQGTYQKCRNPKDEPKFKTLDAMPPAPETLNEYGKKLWEAGNELAEAGVLTAADLFAYEEMCAVYGRYKTLSGYINEDAIENVQGAQGGRSAQAQQMNADYNSLIKAFNAFGLDPAGRNRFGVTRKQDVDPDNEKMKELLYA